MGRIADSIGVAGVKIVLLSRFNLYIPRFRARAGIDAATYLGWCRNRVALFKAYTLPSVRAQSFQRFDWLIWFDTELNPPIAALLAELALIPNIRPILFDARAGGIKAFLNSVGEEVGARIPAGVDYVCTARIDTDDAFNLGYMASVNGFLRRLLPAEVAVPLRFEYLFGAQLHDGLYRAYLYDRNPFVGLVERVTRDRPQRTAFGFPHTLDDPLRRRLLSSQPQWLQVIHGGNAANAVKEELLPFADPAGLSRLFGIGGSDPSPQTGLS